MIAELTNHVWQSTLFAVSVGLLTVAFRKNRAQVRYWLWFGASVKFFVPFVLLARLGSLWEWPAAAPVIARPDIPVTMLRISEPFAAAVPFTAAAPQTTDWGLIAILGAWAYGFAFLAWTRLRGWLQVRAAVKSSVAVELAGAVPVRVSPGLVEPGIVGLFRPILLLPAGIVERLTTRQLEAVLAHELCHVRRRDNLTSAIYMFVEAVFWFHPLVWWIGGRLLEERERACDEGVLAVGSAPGDYAEGILAVCKSYVESPLRCVSGVTGADLKKRIQAILADRIPEGLSVARKAALIAAGLAALVSPLIIGSLNAPALRAQSIPAVRPKFEVASIRPCDHGGGRNMKMDPPGGSPVVSPGRLNTGCASLAGAYPTSGLIQRAYGGLKLGGPPPLGSALPVSGGPTWIYSDYYRINAEAADRASEKTMEGPMLQALLDDRFKLKVHRETREVPVYALTVARGGSRLKAADETCIPPDYSTYPMPALPPGKKYCEPGGVGWRNGENLKLNAEPATVDYFCKLLGLVLDRPTVDRTGLRGQYAFHLKFAMDQSMHEIPEGFGPHSDESLAPSIFTAVQEQLGLKLESARGPREFLVIDHVERPSEN